MDTSGEGCCAALLSALRLIQSCYITRRQHSLPRSSQRGRSSWNLGFIGFTAPPVNRTGMDRTANLGGKGRRWTCPAEIVYYVRVTHASIRHSISFACVTKAHGPGVVEFLPQTYCQQASRSSFRPTHRAEGGGRRAVTGAGGGAQTGTGHLLLQFSCRNQFSVGEISTVGTTTDESLTIEQPIAL